MRTRGVTNRVVSRESTVENGVIIDTLTIDGRTLVNTHRFDDKDSMIEALDRLNEFIMRWKR